MINDDVTSCILYPRISILVFFSYVWHMILRFPAASVICDTVIFMKMVASLVISFSFFVILFI